MHFYTQFGLMCELNVMFWIYGGASYLFSDFLQLLLVLPDQLLAPRRPVQLPAQRSDLESAGAKVKRYFKITHVGILQNPVTKDLGPPALKLLSIPPGPAVQPGSWRPAAPLPRPSVAAAGSSLRPATRPSGC